MRVRNLLCRFWSDDHGFIVSVELLFICAILVVGIVGGLTVLRDAVTTELGQIGQAVLNLDTGYAISGVGGRTGGSNGTVSRHVAQRVSLGATGAVEARGTVATDEVGGGAVGAAGLTP